MPMTTASAPGKVILFGEHAVVYGRPAIAVPVTKVHASATVEDAPPGAGCTISAPDIGSSVRLSDTRPDPLAMAVRLAAEAARIQGQPDWHVSVRSTIPIAGGLGSGAAVSAALAGAVLAHCDPAFQSNPDLQLLNRLVFEVEKLHHTTPSGIDNTVVVFARPVWFRRRSPPRTFDIAAPFVLVIADTGVASKTGRVVADVRRAWKEDRQSYELIFDAIGDVAEAARRAIGAGKLGELGRLMKRNQRLLRRLDVSTPLLDRLIAVAEGAGADGAKLSGGGRGGNLIALVEKELAGEVGAALLESGATRVIETQVGA